MEVLRCIKKYNNDFVAGREYKCLGVDEFDFGKRIIDENNEEIVINLDCVDEYFQEI